MQLYLFFIRSNKNSPLHNPKAIYNPYNQFIQLCLTIFLLSSFMDRTVILLLAVIAILLCIMSYLLIINIRNSRLLKSCYKKDVEQPREDEDTEVETVSAEIKNLRSLAERCEQKLLPEQRGMVKILIEKEYPELPAILQIENLKISLKRDHKNNSMFDAHNVIYALNLARCGHNRSARHLPNRSEIKLILTYRDIINVYLEELGLDLISDKDSFWFLDTPSNWTFKWKYYHWSLVEATEKLKNKIFIYTPDGVKRENSLPQAKVVLLLNGWFDMFEEI